MIKLNTEKFYKSLKALEKENQKSIDRVLYKTGTLIINTAEPMVPILEGNLVGSWSISIAEKIIKEEKEQAGKNPQSPNPPPISGAKKNELRVSYNMPYAYRLHEFPFNPGVKSTEKGLTKPGYKWLNRAIAKLNLPSFMARQYKLENKII